MRRNLNITVSLLAAGLPSLLLLQPVAGLFGRAYGIAGEVSLAVLGEADETTPDGAADLAVVDTEPSVDPAGRSATIRPIDAETATPSPSPTSEPRTPGPATATPHAPTPKHDLSHSSTPEPLPTATSTVIPQPKRVVQHLHDITPTATATPPATKGVAGGVTATQVEPPATYAPAAGTCPAGAARLSIAIDLAQAELSLTNTGETSLQGAWLRLTILSGAPAVQQIHFAGQAWDPEIDGAANDFEVDAMAPGATMNLVLSLAFAPAADGSRPIELLIELWSPACDAAENDLLAKQTAAFVAPALELTAEPEASTEEVAP